MKIMAKLRNKRWFVLRLCLMFKSVAAGNFVECNGLELEAGGGSSIIMVGFVCTKQVRPAGLTCFVYWDLSH